MIEYVNISECKAGDVIIFRKNFDDTYSAKFKIIDETTNTFGYEKLSDGSKRREFKHHFPKVYKVF